MRKVTKLGAGGGLAAAGLGMLVASGVFTASAAIVVGPGAPSASARAGLTPFDSCDELLSWYRAEGLRRVGAYGWDGDRPVYYAMEDSAAGMSELRSTSRRHTVVGDRRRRGQLGDRHQHAGGRGRRARPGQDRRHRAGARGRAQRAAERRDRRPAAGARLLPSPGLDLRRRGDARRRPGRGHRDRCAHLRRPGGRELGHPPDRALGVAEPRPRARRLRPRPADPGDGPDLLRHGALRPAVRRHDPAGHADPGTCPALRVPLRGHRQDGRARQEPGAGEGEHPRRLAADGRPTPARHRLRGARAAGRLRRGAAPAARARAPARSRSSASTSTPPTIGRPWP